MRRLVVLLLFLAVAVLVARPANAEDVTATARIRTEIAALASSTDAAGGAEVAFVSSESSVNFIRGHAWILTLWIGDAPAYGGEYFILSEIGGRLTGELLLGPGEDKMRSFVGEELTRYLARVELDAAPIRDVFERYYRGPR
jgi:hypothetical protein